MHAVPIAFWFIFGDNFPFAWEIFLRYKIQEPTAAAQACIIWMHGLGADSSDMEGVVAAMQGAFLPVRHIFLDAPLCALTINNGMRMPAWFDIVGPNLVDREDEAGIRASAQSIEQIIAVQREQGFSAAQIYLAGFSQGGAMALYTGLCQAASLGGLMILSGYLPMARSLVPMQPRNVPIFLAGGRRDPVVLPQWTDLTETWLRQQGYVQIHSQRYPMEHSICMEEIVDLQRWLQEQMREAKA